MPLEKRAAAAVGVTVGRWWRRRRRTGQGAAALHPAGLTLTSFFFLFFFTSLNWRLDKESALAFLIWMRGEM